jgi:hypothetical protein
MATQAPRAPVESQASHWPEHAESQQTPSAQKPEAHSTAPPQVWPGVFWGTHRPAEQKLPGTHWASVVQLPRQAVAPHRNSPQGWVAGAGQAPWPLHPAASVAVPAAHVGARQLMDPPGYAQAEVEVPSQAPRHRLPSVAQGCLPARGLPETGLQMPGWPGSAQAAHWPLQAVSQQTPSTQKPEVHWLLPPQVAAWAFLAVHTPAEHQFPVAQSVSTEQEALQAVAPQRNGAQP